MKNSPKRLLQSAAFCVLAAFLLPGMLPARASGDDDSPLVLNSSEELFGKKMSEWSAEWWQYMLSIPIGSNPLIAPGQGEFCGVAQRAPVWFLAGTLDSKTAFRKCTIPQGVALFFPLVNTSMPTTTLRPKKWTSCVLRSRPVSTKPPAYCWW